MEDDIATDPEETVEDVEKKTAEILALQAEEEKKKQANFCASSIQLDMNEGEKLTNEKTHFLSFITI